LTDEEKEENRSHIISVEGQVADEEAKEQSEEEPSTDEDFVESDFDETSE
jgi:hypothetical protein